MMNPRIVTCTVNYRTAGLTLKCLRSLMQTSRAEALSLHCTIVDNGSDDGSVERIQEWIALRECEDRVTLLPLEQNIGFAGGNNAAIRHAMRQLEAPDYFWLVNPDASVHPGACEALLRFMEAHPKAGIVGSVMESPEGRPELSAHRFPSWMGELSAAARLAALDRLVGRGPLVGMELTRPTRQDWVSGAGMMIRRAVLDQVGLLDEGYFLYFEEADFSRRARSAGWETWLEPASRVMHLEGKSTGFHGRGLIRSPHWRASRRRYYLKHHGLLGLALADAACAIGRLSFAGRRRLGLATGRGEAGRPLALLWEDARAVINGEASIGGAQP